jgi:hypothetical protein
MPFIIGIKGGGVEEYYAGLTYTYLGTIFPVYVDRDQAKRYVSKFRAENVAKTLSQQYKIIFSVDEISE